MVARDLKSVNSCILHWYFGTDHYCFDGGGGGGKLFAEAASTEVSCMHLANKKSVCKRTETHTKKIVGS